ncbi:MAG: hypothetical protein HIU81_04245 [Acidobacteria bacterium]|nr:hypothetical protein [Acidobacteriota bacterium]
MLCLAVIFLSGAAVDIATRSDATAVAMAYIVGSVLLCVVCGVWFIRNPPALRSSASAYLYTLCCLEFGALFGGAIEPLRGCGGWLLLGLGIAVYGYLERGRVIMTAGVASALAAIVAIVGNAPVLGGGMQALSALVFAVAAYRLHYLRNGPRSRKEPLDLNTLTLL